MTSKISNVDLYRVFAGILLVVGLIPFFRIPYFVQAIEDGASYNDFIIVVVTLGAFLSMVYVVLTRQRVPAPFGWILLFQFCVLPFRSLMVSMHKRFFHITSLPLMRQPIVGSFICS